MHTFLRFAVAQCGARTRRWGGFGRVPENQVFAHRPSNRQRNGWVVSLLDVQPADQVLEIGFGPGLAVAELVRAGAGHVYGSTIPP